MVDVTASPEAALMPLDTLDIELTLRCPLRCKHCSAFASPLQQLELDADVLIAAVRRHPRFKELYLSGGEPFAHTAFTHVVGSLVTSCDVLVAYSSGTTTKFDGSISPLDTEVLYAARAAGLQRIDLSVYSDQPAEHDAVTATPGSMQATLTSIERAAAVGLEVGIHTVPMGPRAAQAVIGVARIARSLAVGRLHVLAVTSQGRAHGRAAELAPSIDLNESLASLRATSKPGWLVLSRELRRGLGDYAASPRDAWRTGFLTARGHLAIGEGRRDVVSESSILRGQSLQALSNELEWS